MRDDYIPNRDDITAVNVSVLRQDDGSLDVRLYWTRCGVESAAEVSHRLGVDPGLALTFARDAVLQLMWWHTTLADVYATLAGEDRGLSAER
jgi:hypothetical protein